MEERIKRFELTSELYRYLMDLPQSADGVRQTFQWLLEYSRVCGEKLLLAILESDHGTFQPLAEVGCDPLLRERFRGGIFPHIEVVRETRQPVMFNDLIHDGNESFREWACAEQIQTFWVFPIIVRGTVTGTLAVAYSDKRVWTPFEAQYWTRVTDTLALFLAEAQQESQRALQTEQFEATLTMTGAGVLGFWSSGEVAFHNQRFLDMFHLQSDQVTGHFSALLRRIGPQLEDPAGVMRAVDQLVNETTPNTFEVVARLKGVIPREIRMRTRPLVANGQVNGWLALFDDYTRERAVETQQQAFLSLVAHEFRTPISVIAGVSEYLLEEGIEDSFVQEQVQIISRESTRLMRLIREVWLSVRLDDPLWRIDSTEICVPEIVRSEGALRLLAAPHRTIHYHGAEHAHIQGNREIVTTIISTLLSNAIRFSPVDTPIEAEVAENGNMVRLTVMDRGPGVDEHVEKELFLRMPDPRRRSSSGGIGIGLWLSHQLLSRIGGRIAYDLRPGGGSLFTVWFPYRPQTLGVLPASGESPPAIAGA